MDIKFRPLNENEIKCRVQSNNDKMAVLLLYKDARVDYDLLDEVVGATNWQCKYEVINSNLYCSIGIWDSENKEWVWKSNCGTESNTEKEKGEASDSFKRAGFCWGVGRELYSAPKTKIYLEPSDFYESNGKQKLKTTFEVIGIEYDENKKITYLAIVDDDGDLRFEFKNGCCKSVKKGKTTAKNEQPKNLMGCQVIAKTDESVAEPNYNNEILEYWNYEAYDYKPMIKKYLESVGANKFKDLVQEARKDLVERLRGIR